MNLYEVLFFMSDADRESDSVRVYAPNVANALIIFRRFFPTNPIYSIVRVQS